MRFSTMGAGMELRQYVALLRKWFWLVILLAVIAAAASFVISRRSARIYQASVTLMVNQANNPAITAGYSDILTSERLARTYASLLVSQPVLDETAQRLGISPKLLDGAITVTPVRDTQLLQIKVEGTLPELTAQIANTLPVIFVERNAELQLGRATASKLKLEEEIANTEKDLAETQQQLEAVTDETQRTRLEPRLA